MILGQNSDIVRSCIIMLEEEIIPDKWGKWYHILFQDICYINCAIRCPSGKNIQIGTSRRTYTTPNHLRKVAFQECCFRHSVHLVVELLLHACQVTPSKIWTHLRTVLVPIHYHSIWHGFRQTADVLADELLFIRVQVVF
jgi:hypothetical protein